MPERLHFLLSVGSQDCIEAYEFESESEDPGHLSDEEEGEVDGDEAYVRLIAGATKAASGFKLHPRPEQVETIMAGKQLNLGEVSLPSHF